MTEAQTALSRRVVACKGWRWLPGTLRLRATPPSRRDHLLREGRVPDCGDPWVYEDWPVIPDVTDAATLGCLLALVREAWGDPFGFLENQGPNEPWNDLKLEIIERDCVLGLQARPAGLLPPGCAQWIYHPHGALADPVEMPVGDTEAEALVAALESAP